MPDGPVRQVPSTHWCTARAQDCCLFVVARSQDIPSTPLTTEPNRKEQRKRMYLMGCSSSAGFLNQNGSVLKWLARQPRQTCLPGLGFRGRGYGRVGERR